MAIFFLNKQFALPLYQCSELGGDQEVPLVAEAISFDSGYTALSVTYLRWPFPVSHSH